MPSKRPARTSASRRDSATLDEVEALHVAVMTNGIILNSLVDALEESGRITRDDMRAARAFAAARCARRMTDPYFKEVHRELGDFFRRFKLDDRPEG